MKNKIIYDELSERDPLKCSWTLWDTVTWKTHTNWHPSPRKKVSKNILRHYKFLATKHCNPTLFNTVSNEVSLWLYIHIYIFLKLCKKIDIYRDNFTQYMNPFLVAKLNDDIYPKSKEKKREREKRTMARRLHREDEENKWGCLMVSDFDQKKKKKNRERTNDMQVPWQIAWNGLPSVLEIFIIWSTILLAIKLLQNEGTVCWIVERVGPVVHPFSMEKVTPRPSMVPNIVYMLPDPILTHHTPDLVQKRK